MSVKESEVVREDMMVFSVHMIESMAYSTFSVVCSVLAVVFVLWIVYSLVRNTPSTIIIKKDDAGDMVTTMGRSLRSYEEDDCQFAHPSAAEQSQY